MKNISVNQVIRISQEDLESHDLVFLKDIFWEFYPKSNEWGATPEPMKKALLKIGSFLAQKKAKRVSL